MTEVALSMVKVNALIKFNAAMSDHLTEMVVTQCYISVQLHKLDNNDNEASCLLQSSELYHDHEKSICAPTLLLFTIEFYLIRVYQVTP